MRDAKPARSRLRRVILYAFLVGLVLAIAALVYVIVSGISLWRHAKRTGGAFSTELSRFEERAARTERLFADADRSNRELEAALERLRVSRARLQVLLETLERAQSRTRWLRALLPS